MALIVLKIFKHLAKLFFVILHEIFFRGNTRQLDLKTEIELVVVLTIRNFLSSLKWVVTFDLHVAWMSEDVVFFYHHVLSLVTFVINYDYFTPH
jgi:hypothetical protein